MTALQALLNGLIDYAGLFPPANLDMKTAVRNYAAYRDGANAYALRTFIIPAQRLAEFTAAFQEVCCDEQGSPWLLSLTGGENLEDDLSCMDAFREGAAFLHALEVKASSAASVEQALAALPSGLEFFVEFALEQSQDVLPVLKEKGAYAKIRTGGIVAEAFPAMKDVAQFLVSCAEADVGFKATAGLHHPLRSIQKLTYDSDSESTLMHGFLNVFVAAIVAYSGSSLTDVENALAQQETSAIHWRDDELVFGAHRLSIKQISEARKKFAISFGSCSFTEPVNDLKALGWLK